METVSSYLFHPIFIFSRFWRIIYYPLLHYFNLPIGNHDTIKHAHVLSLVYSIITTCLTPYTYYLIYNNYWLPSQISTIVTTFVHSISVSYFISDLAIGLQFYPNIMNSNILTSYVHHGAYILLFTWGKFYNKSHLFIMGMPYEIPTILLNIQNITDTKKNYKLFGLLFLFFRIFHNIFLLYKTYMVHNDMFIFCICTFILHIYWFTNYIKKYAFN